MINLVNNVKKYRSQKGSGALEIIFTVIVVTVISYMTIYFLNDARKNARLSYLENIMRPAVPAALACLDSRIPIGRGTADTAGYPPQAGLPVCAGSSFSWPALSGDWTYEPDEFASTTSSLYSGTFSFSARSFEDKKEIYCNERGCEIINLE